MAEVLNVTLTLEPRGPAGAFLLSDEQVAAVGGGRRAFPVRVRVNGATLPLRLARMGGENLIGLARAGREQAGVSIGSTYQVEIVAEEGERGVEVPADLARAVADDGQALAAFEALALAHRKEFVRWVSEAKRDATRAQRITKTVEMLRAGQQSSGGTQVDPLAQSWNVAPSTIRLTSSKRYLFSASRRSGQGHVLLPTWTQHGCVSNSDTTIEDFNLITGSHGCDHRPAKPEGSAHQDFGASRDP